MSDFSPPDVTEIAHRRAAQRADGRSDPAAARTEDGLGFWDLVDIVNPLQHIPVVSSVYRHLTGDEIRPEARIFGATLYGGPVGLAVSVAGAVVEQATGRTVEEHAFALFDGEADPAEPDDTEAETLAAGPDDATQVAETAPAPALPETQALPPDAVPPNPQTAVLPHGFPLTPRDWTGPRALPPSVPAAAPPVEATAPLRPATTGPLAIGADIDAALARLAAESAEEQAAEAVAEVPTPAPAGAAGPAAAHPLMVPDGQVPEAMMRALDLYRRSAAAPAASVQPALDTRS